MEYKFDEGKNLRIRLSPEKSDDVESIRSVTRKIDDELWKLLSNMPGQLKGRMPTSPSPANYSLEYGPLHATYIFDSSLITDAEKYERNNHSYLIAEINRIFGTSIKFDSL